MSKSYGAQSRRELMGQVLKIIDKNPDIPIEKIEALAGIDIGLSPRKVREYLRQFVASGRVLRTAKGFRFVGS